ncbi:gliding motility-associated C-terminal domain-containing protein [Salegentibacter holothuriorum]|uniref:Gliding motility-associated C-terminal domain-containing protein n=1 Tax=Salegentibacter holothuriorum TaxID=241145 RepID=A0A1T5CHV0_9FLAO|nr:T9SS type B sorting domain-containing protein [Salegentibacter holothuriorum]SKB59048.1 gliding motility-associated C-terminal domain-containing protein [Salegentibacter holothuriorum]
MKQKSLLLFLLFLVYGSVEVIFAQGEVCSQIEPFCAGDELVFENSNTANSAVTEAEAGPYYGELLAQPYPSWYFLQIGQAGNLDFVISQTENADGSGVELDVDYVVWGPFSQGDDICDYNMLSEENLVSSSYSNKAVETLQLEAAEVGEIYVVIITNFRGDPGYIKLEQENINETGAGATDCFTNGLEDEVFACQGETIILDGTILFAESYKWFKKVEGEFKVLEGENEAYLEVDEEGEYKVIVTDNLANITEDFVSVEFKPEPIANTPTDLYVCDPNQTTIDLTLASKEILAGNTSEENYRVSFYTSLEEFGAENPIGNPTAFPLDTNTEFFAQVEGVESSCLSEPVSFNAEIELLPENYLPEETIVCVDLNGDIARQTKIGEDLGGNYTYQWFEEGNLISTNAVLELTEVPEAKSIELIVANSKSGCKVSFQTVLTVYSKPESVLFEIEGTDFTGGYVVTAEAIPGPGEGTTYEYRLDEGRWRKNPVFRNLNPGYHTLSAREINGCGITTSEKFFLVGYPRFFTPNADGYNDTWSIADTAEIKILKLYIFDRYGKLLKELSPGGQGWDGTYNGRSLPADDYWFRVEFEMLDGTRDHFGANFTLKR